MTQNAKPAKQYISAKTYSIIARSLLGLCIVISLLGLAVGQMGSAFVSRAEAGERVTRAEGTQLDQLQGTIALADTATLVITGIVFLMWLKRTRDNLSTMGVEKLKYGDVDAIGGFMVPVLNLYRPPIVMQETWKACSPQPLEAEAWQSLKSSMLITIWWVFWLLRLCLWIAVTMASSEMRHAAHPSLSTIHAYYQSWAAAELVQAITGILAILMVAKITARQEEKHTNWLAQQTQP